MAKQDAPFIVSVGKGIKAKVWTDTNQKGVWYSVTFARSYRDESGNLHDADNYLRDELLHVARAAEKAFDYINSQLHGDAQ